MCTRETILDCGGAFIYVHTLLTTSERRQRCHSNRILSGKGVCLVLQRLTISPQLVNISQESLFYDLLTVCGRVLSPSSLPASHIDPRDDIAISTIQTSLAILMDGSALVSKLPFIAPAAGLLSQALTMRDASVTNISPDNLNVLIYASPGSKTIQKGVRKSYAESRQNRKDHCQCRHVVRR